MEPSILQDAPSITQFSWSLLLGTVEDLVDPDQDSCILDDPNHNAAFLPFGSGTRACVGQKFVILGVAALFASLLEHYEVCCFSSHYLC